jgi:hypothetical protein
MVGTKGELLNPPRSLPRFLAMWLATYLIPFLVTWAAAIAALFGSLAIFPPSGRYASAMVSLCLLPIGLAVGQWMLMRSYVAKPRPWSAATLVGALLAQLSAMLVPEVTQETLASLPQLSRIYDILRPIFGSEVAIDTLVMLPIALCYGAAWSIPQGLALPGLRSAKIVWMIALMLTGFAVVVMAKALSYELREAFALRRAPNLFLLAASSLLPTTLGWLMLSLVSGSIMYWSLRRGSAVGVAQVLTRCRLTPRPRSPPDR